LKEFHRPTDLSDALALLGRKSPRTVPLAGGTWLNPRISKEVADCSNPAAEAVVDLSELGLDQIECDANTLRLGAMVTLEDVAKNETCCSLADGILVETARRDATVNVRNAATVGGTVVVAPAGSEFLLALLALEAELNTLAPSVPSRKSTTWSLRQFLSHLVAAPNDELVIQVQIRLPTHAASGMARVARTPSDHPIVAAVAIIAKQPDTMRIALSGVGPHPLLVEFDRPKAMEEAVACALHPARGITNADRYADFRGTDDYRRAMGALTAKRAFEQALGRSV
jgi:CO/xanthine dehydrogenase FAD-binding subunit